MGYRHRTQKGKYINFKSKNAYENWKRGMFANLSTSNSSKRKIVKAKTKSRRRLQHKGVGKVSSAKKFCETCKGEGKSFTKGKCKICVKEFKKFDQPKSKESIHELRKIKDDYHYELHNLMVKKSRQRAGFGDHLAFPEEERLQELFELFSEAHGKWAKKVREVDPDYFNRGINTFRLGHEVDIKSGKESCSMCRGKDLSLTKGKCKVCRKLDKEFAGERERIAKKAVKGKMDAYIVDRISGGWGELKKSKQGKHNTRILFYKQEAYEPQNSSYVVLRMNEVTEHEGRISSPQTNDSRQFSVRSGGLIAAIRKAKEYYEALE